MEASNPCPCFYPGGVKHIDSGLSPLRPLLPGVVTQNKVPFLPSPLLVSSADILEGIPEPRLLKPQAAGASPLTFRNNITWPL